MKRTVASFLKLWNIHDWIILFFYLFTAVVVSILSGLVLLEMHYAISPPFFHLFLFFCGGSISIGSFYKLIDFSFGGYRIYKMALSPQYSYQQLLDVQAEHFRNLYIRYWEDRITLPPTVENRDYNNFQEARDAKFRYIYNYLGGD